jgi:phospholipid/cholesterol/gamma-HCH transport system substrate-binding protein
MNESVAGLNDESPVKYNGVRVGFISDIELSSSNPQKVKLLVKVEQGVPITMDTQATLITQGITGTTYLGLTATSSSLIPIQRRPNEPYPVIAYKPSFYHLLERSINRLSSEINEIFNEENTKNFGRTLTNLEHISAVIAKDDQQINQSLRELPLLIQSLRTSTEKFNTMADDVSIAGNQFTKTMQAGKSSIDQLSQQTIPAAVTLIRRLDTIAANLEVVSNQLRQNPSVIIRGNTPPKRGPGE